MIGGAKCKATLQKWAGGAREMHVAPFHLCYFCQCLAMLLWFHRETREAPSCRNSHQFSRNLISSIFDNFITYFSRSVLFIFLSDFVHFCLFILFSLVYFQSISFTLIRHQPSAALLAYSSVFCAPYRPESLPSFFFYSFLPSFLFLPILAYFTVTAGLRLWCWLASKIGLELFLHLPVYYDVFPPHSSVSLFIFPQIIEDSFMRVIFTRYHLFFFAVSTFLTNFPSFIDHNSSFLVSWSIAFPHVASSIDMADFDFDRSVSVSLLSSSFQQQHKNSVLPLSFCLTS